MAKTSELKEAKTKKEPSKPKDKNGDALVGRVKKVIKKSRRKMGDEKFEKQLQRTIGFLEELQRRMSEAGNDKAEKKVGSVPKASKAKKARPKTKTR